MRLPHTSRALIITALVAVVCQAPVFAEPGYSSGSNVAPLAADPTVSTSPASTFSVSVSSTAALSGGSNYDFYYLNGCYREPFYVVNGFNKAPTIIKFQLAGMKKAGQNRLAITIFHHRGPDSGAVMDSTGGNLSTQNLQNLIALLAAIKQAGFAEITVGFAPMYPNDPGGWDSWQDDVYQENWQLIQHVHQVVSASGLAYHLDLGNELTASTNQNIVLQYDKQLWQDYTKQFGTSDTVGFSVNSNDPGQILNVAKIYGSAPPPIFDLHMYGSEKDQYVSDDSQLRKMGYTTQPIIIGEAFYNDHDAAANFSEAVSATGRPIRYLTQWPKTQDNANECDQVNVAPPIAFNEYAAKGF